MKLDWSNSFMSLIFQDLRYAVRTLRKNFGLTAVIVLSLAIGIGANTAIFSVVNALLLKPLPYPEPDRLAILWLRSPGIGIPQDWPSPGQYMDIKAENHSFDELSISIGGSFNLTGRDRPERLEGMRTSSTLLACWEPSRCWAGPFCPRKTSPEKHQRFCSRMVCGNVSSEAIRRSLEEASR
jgi:hypothetical protein